MRLANRLQALGYAIDRKRDDFEIAGVSPATIRRFSRRTDKIEELAREKGIEDPEAKARLGGLIAGTQGQEPELGGADAASGTTG